MPVLTLRIDDQLDALLRVAAAESKTSVNAWLAQAARAAVLRQAVARRGGPLAAMLDGVSAPATAKRERKRAT